MLGPSEGDRQLIEAARKKLKACYRPRRHEISAALRTRSGRIYAAVNLDTRLRRASVCAEAVVIGMAVGAGDSEIEAIVAVNRETTRSSLPAASAVNCSRTTLPQPASSSLAPQARNPCPLALLPRRYNKDGTP